MQDFKRVNRNRVQVLKSGSKIKYLTPPSKYAPAELVRNGTITCPRFALKYDALNAVKINAAASVKYSRGYFLSRENENFYLIAYVTSGEYQVRHAGKTETIARGMLYLTAPMVFVNSSCPKKDASIIWFHLKNSREWSGLLGKNNLLKKALRLKNIEELIGMYEDEIYLETPSIFYLNALAECIAENIRREFYDSNAASINRISCAGIYYQINAAPYSKLSLQYLSKKFHTTPKKINDIFKSARGKSVYRHILETKMKKAVEKLSAGVSIKGVSKILGYADRSSFSKAFARYYKTPPRAYVKNMRISANKEEPPLK